MILSFDPEATQYIKNERHYNTVQNLKSVFTLVLFFEYFVTFFYVFLVTSTVHTLPLRVSRKIAKEFEQPTLTTNFKLKVTIHNSNLRLFVLG